MIDGRKVNKWTVGKSEIDCKIICVASSEFKLKSLRPVKTRLPNGTSW